MITSQEIKNYLLENPIDRTQENPYDKAANALQIDKELVRRIWRGLRRQGLVEKEVKTFIKKELYASFTNEGYTEERKEDGSVRIQENVDRRLTDDELFERYGRNRGDWKIISVWFKDRPNGFMLSVHFAPLKIDQNLSLQKDFILNAIKEHSPKTNYPKQPSSGEEGECLYEIAIPDLHIGKMAWGQEVGEDYDIKIAVDRYKSAVEALLSRIDISMIDRFLLPIGNDMINIDNKSNTTTAGTPQSADSRFGKMFRTAKELLIETIDRLADIAPVDVVVVAGNHDNLSMFTLGEVLSAWYHNSDRVEIDNSPKQRKYYQYGNTSIQFTHGNQEKHLELGLIFATEEAELWADTKFRYCQLGHYHHTKKTQYVSVQEYQGFQVQIIPSLSGTDAWHYEKGYNSMKQAKGFLIHREDGLLAETTHTV